MLVLRRKLGEEIIIDDNIVIKIVKLEGNAVKIGITAPPDVLILRKELRKEEREGV
jgi:carbon storage regulator